MNLPRYVLVTPARNEADFIERTIQSVVRQTIRPAKWVIVSDGSTDGTDEIVGRYASEHPWIELLRMPERQERHFAGKAHACNTGYAALKDMPHEAVASLDGDISFDEEYFEFLLRKLVNYPKLGLVGTPYQELTGVTYDYRFVSIEHVSGACQLFRRECFEQVGGYVPMKGGGVDLAALWRARSKGWETRSFTEKTCIHYRKMGAAQHTGFRERLHRGRMDYILGSHPLWEVFRSAHQMKNKPYVIGGILILWAYFWNLFRGVERTMPEDLIVLRREDQMKRLKALFRRKLHLSGPVSYEPNI